MSNLLLSLLVAASTTLPPVITPAPGTYTSPQSVYVRAQSAGSIIRCTTNGGTPTISSTRYTAPLTVAATTTVKCAAWAQNKKMSTVVSALYTINIQPVTDPLNLVATIAAGAAACFAAPVTGTNIYYFCDCATGGPSDAQPDAACAVGNDASAGTIGAPWRTWSKVVTTMSTMAAGSTIALCRGGAWDASSGDFRRNNNCYNVGKTSYCTMRDYVASFNAASTARPVLWNNGRTSARGPFKFDDSSTTTHGNYRFHNMYFRNTAADHWVWTFFYNDARNVEFCNNDWNGSNNAFQVTIGPGCAAGSDCNKGAYVHHNYLRNLADFGMLAQGTEWRVEYNDFDTTGGLTNREHAIYAGANGGYTVYNMTIIGNRIRNSVHSPTGPNGVCMGTPLIVHGFYDGLTISSNYLDEPNSVASSGCWGINVNSNLEGTANFFRNVTISGNVLKNMGGVGILTANSQTVKIENNLVIKTNGASGFEAIVGDDRDWSSSGDAVGRDITIRNNTIYYGPGTSNGGAIRGVSDGTNYVVNNVVYGSGGGSCYTSAGNTVVAGNVCTLAGSPAATTYFTNPTNTDFSLAVGSPLKDAGSTANPPGFPTTDIAGNPRATPPSVGAYE